MSYAPNAGYAQLIALQAPYQKKTENFRFWTPQSVSDAEPAKMPANLMQLKYLQ